MKTNFRCWFMHSNASCWLQEATGTDYRNFKSPFKMFRLLVHLRRGRHPWIPCCKGTCLLQSLSKVPKNLLYTTRVIMVAQKSNSCSSEFGLPNFCQEVLYPGEVLHETGGGWKQGRKKHSAARTKGKQTGKIKACWWPVLPCWSIYLWYIHCAKYIHFVHCILLLCFLYTFLTVDLISFCHGRISRQATEVKGHYYIKTAH